MQRGATHRVRFRVQSALSRSKGLPRLIFKHLQLGPRRFPFMIEVTKKSAILPVDTAGKPNPEETAQFCLELVIQNLLLLSRHGHFRRRLSVGLEHGLGTSAAARFTSSPRRETGRNQVCDGALSTVLCRCGL